MADEDDTEHLVGLTLVPGSTLEQLDEGVQPGIGQRYPGADQQMGNGVRIEQMHDNRG